MATTISRTAYNLLVDDDGTGTTGTIWGKANVDDILDAIDALLAGTLVLGADVKAANAAGNVVLGVRNTTSGGDVNGQLQALTNQSVRVGSTSAHATELTYNNVVGATLGSTGFDIVGAKTVRQIVAATATGDFTTSSTSLVNVTNAVLSITTGASATVIVYVSVPVLIASGQALFDWSIDSVDDGAVQGVISSTTATTMTLFRRVTGLSAAAHTFQLRARSSGGGQISMSMSSVMNGSMIGMEFR